MRQRIDALQQLLLSMGESVYQQAQDTSNNDRAYTNHTVPAAMPWQEGELAAYATETLDGDFATDETITAEYEAVD
jgi:molecular chaperone DnaK